LTMVTGTRGRVGSRTWGFVWDRACEICAKTRTEWRWPYVIGSERASGHGGTCGIEDVWVRVGSCVWRAYGCTEHAKTTMCGIVCEDEDVWRAAPRNMR
jgi:hypothetical protein